MRAVHLLRRAGREFVRNLIWMLAVFGPLAAILVPTAHLPLLGVLAFVVVSVSVMAAILTMLVLWSGVDGEVPLGADGLRWSERGNPPPDQSHPGIYGGGSHGAYGGAEYSGGHGGGEFGGGGDGGGGGR